MDQIKLHSINYFNNTTVKYNAENRTWVSLTFEPLNSKDYLDTNNMKDLHTFSVSPTDHGTVRIIRYCAVVFREACRDYVISV